MTTPPAIVKILNEQKAIAGLVPYSETASTRLDHGISQLKLATDCSGMAARMYAWAAGINIGTYTGNECLHGTLVTSSKGAARLGYGMLPGDLIFFDWDGGSWDHVAIYAGAGRIWNHGGPGKGPLNWALQSNVDAAVKITVRRIIAPLPGTVVHPPVVSATLTNPMHNKPIPALIAQGTDDFFGLITGGNASHGGAYSVERPPIELIQEFCNFKEKAGLKVDGIFGPSTFAAVTALQKRYLPKTTNFGEVWFDDWHWMASQ